MATLSHEQPLSTHHTTPLAYDKLIFLPHDTCMHNAVGCLSVCLSVTSLCSVETAELIELTSGTEVIMGSSYTVL